MKNIVALILLSLVVDISAGCTNKDASTQPSQPGRVIATSAYEKYFGGAPPVDKGTAYAFVIYFPSSGAPGKVVPFPFFTFDEASSMKVAAERLLGGMDVGSYQGEFIQYPKGSRILGINNDQGTVTVNLSKEFLAITDKPTAASAVSALLLTVRQFTAAKDVRLQVEGKDDPLNALGKNADDNAVQQPGPPRLLSVTAMRDKGAKEIDDVNAFFDRPVDVKELKLLSKDGQQLAGVLYHSVFDMAGVLRPKDPSQFKERMPIKVRWKVIDKLGRQAEEDTVWLLEVKEH
ncbi:sporulation and spore germination protein [Geobacter argillaceus]|uniref:Sporulation and spore germination protein n=1 Tax=Geobacter argillaceus TaxID=345631 RepID=A0A562VMJ1_9BACT|nr:sporulation and spore germination protein [Geobacter argillaceus]